MEDGPLWSIDSVGNYWLMFPNKHALSVVEIRKIFSEFGYVKNVTQAGDEKGLRFVQYTNLIDTEKAVENLKNHPTVSLRKHRPNQKKSNTNNNQNDDDSSKLHVNENDYKKNMFPRKKPMPTDTALSDTESCNIQASSRQSNDNYGPKLFNKIHNLPNKIDDKNFFERSSSVNYAFKDDSIFSSRASTAVISSSQQNGKGKMFVKLKKVCTPCASQDSSSYTSNNNSISNFDGTISGDDDNNDVDEIPALVTKVKPTSSYIISEAGEVIVGNIHPKYGAGYMLYLFQNYEPIAVSFMRESANPVLRYCHVYFKNPQDSIDVETQFDKHILSGRNLIVMRPCNLSKEANL